MGHKNRSKAPTNAARSPEPEEIRQVREAAGLTQAAAAKLIFRSLRAWENWEAPKSDPNNRQMFASDWWLFRMLAAPTDKDGADLLAGLRRQQRVAIDKKD